MKRFLLLASTALFFCTVVTSAQKKVTFVPQWTPQAQFAGYYVALEQGFYKEEGLDVEIRHIGVHSTESVLEQLVKGRADIVGQQLLQSMISKSDGNPIVNVMQVTQTSGLMVVSHKTIKSPADLDGCKVGRWKAGYSEICDIVESHTGISVEWVPFINGISLFVYGAVDATLCYSFNEYIALLLAMGRIPQDNVLRFSDYGYSCPEDGLYVTEKYYNKNKDTVDAFVRATKKGWDYVREHKKEALDVTMKYIRNSGVVTNKAHQSMMLDEYLKLQINPETGKADYAPVSQEVFDKLIKDLLSTGYATRALEYNDLIR